jgi:PAS domain S-box-containing protein
MNYEQKSKEELIVEIQKLQEKCNSLVKLYHYDNFGDDPDLEKEHKESKTEVSKSDMLKVFQELEMYKIELGAQNVELRIAKERTEELATQKYSELYDFASSGYFTLSKEGQIIDLNLSGAKILCIERSDANNRDFIQFISEDTKPIFHLFLTKVFNTKLKETCEVIIKVYGKPLMYFQIMGIAMQNEEQCLITLFDISERKLQNDVQEEITRLIALVNTPGDLQDRLSAITKSLQSFSGCEAIGIRLNERDDFPYFETRGFPSDFIQAEKHLCVYGSDGKIMKDSNGIPVLECMCGNVLCGRFDPSKPFYTTYGSFWSNSSTELHKNFSEADLLVKMRNRCNEEGYESVALIPLRTGHQILGLLQINDHRKDCFTPGLIGHYEKMAENLAAALSQRQSEDALRESQSLYHSLIEQLPTPVFRKDRYGRYILVNSKFCRLKGLNVEDLIGKTPLEVAAKEKNIQGENGYAIKYANLGKELHEQIMQTGKYIETEEEYPAKENNKDYWQVIRMPVVDSQGTIIGSQGIMFDITERKRTEELLQRSEEKYREIVENIGEGIAFVNSQEQIAFANSTAEEIFGVGSGELTGRNLEQFVSNEHITLVQKETKLRLQGNKSVYELDIIRPNGEKRTIKITAVPKFENGNEFAGTLGVFHDITESKQSEEALMESEARFRNLLQDMQHISVQGYAPDGTTQYWNRASENLYGYTTEEAIGRNLVDLIIPPEMKKSVREAIEQMSKTGQPIPSSELLLMRKDGSLVSVFSSHTIINVPGRPQELFCIDIDLTERKHTELALRFEQHLMQSLMNHLPSKIYFKDSESRFLRINNAHAKYFGLNDPDEALGKTDFDFFTIEHAQQAFDDEQEIIRTGLSISKEEKETWSDRPDAWVSTTKMPFRDYHENIIGTFGISIDITERKQAEEDLRNSEKKFRELFEANDDGITIFRINPTGPPSVILDMNENAAKMLGYTKTEILNMPALSLEKSVTKEDLEKRRNDLRTKGYTNFESIVKHKDGHDIPVEIKIRIINYNNQPALMNIARDITERKNIEIQLQKYAGELTKLNTDKDRFISILAHDLKSPFNAILGYLELLTKNIHKYEIDKVERQIALITNSAYRFYNLLEDILMWARSQSGKISFDPQKYNFLDICQEVIEILKPNASSKNITINHFATTSINVFADLDMLKSILRNLISNAIKFTNPGGRVDIFAEQDKSNVTISVSDNGIGISQEIISKLFDISQIHTTTGTANETGTGLGLLLCKEFVEKHNGKIWVESESGNGSAFYFTIPKK